MPIPQLANAKLISVSTFNTLRDVTDSIKVTLSAGQAYTHQVASDPLVFDMTSLEIKAYVLDIEVGSPTNGYYVAADAIAAIGWKENGSFIVKNQYTASLDFLIKAIVYRKPIVVA